MSDAALLPAPPAGTLAVHGMRRNPVCALCIAKQNSRPTAILRCAAARAECVVDHLPLSIAIGGRAYLSIKLDDPSLPAPIYATLVEGEQADSYNLIWSRRSGD